MLIFVKYVLQLYITDVQYTVCVCVIDKTPYIDCYVTRWKSKKKEHFHLWQVNPHRPTRFCVTRIIS